MTEKDRIKNENEDNLESQQELKEQSHLSDSEAEEKESIKEKLDKLEKVIRSGGRDNLSLVRGQKDALAKLENVLSQFNDLEFNIKGLTQQVWKVTKENQEHIQKTEQHFAGAIRELDARVRDEIQWQIYKNALQAIFPALDDMDIIINKQKEIIDASGEENGMLEAMIMVRQKFNEGLKKLGLDEIPVQSGETQFDPTKHEAVETDNFGAISADHEITKGTIINVSRPGYYLNGRVFRVPKVSVKG